MGGWPGKYGDQQRFSASTSSATSSVRQKRYADIAPVARLRALARSRRQRSHLVEVAAARRGLLSGRRRGRGDRRLPRRRRGVVSDHLGHHLLAELAAI